MKQYLEILKKMIGGNTLLLVIPGIFVGSTIGSVASGDWQGFFHSLLFAAGVFVLCMLCASLVVLIISKRIDRDDIGPPKERPKPRSR